MIPIVSSLKCYIFWKKSIDNRDFEEKKWLYQLKQSMQSLMILSI